MNARQLLIALLAIFATISPTFAFDGTKQEETKQEETTAQDSASRQQKLATYLTGATLAGTFTIDGVAGKVHDEKYTISKCEVLPQKDMYRITSHMKYLSFDDDFSIDLKILWSGSTPVITIDAMWIPGMGIIGSRILIHADSYAGTWRHGEYTGHMFGKIEKE